MPLPSINELTTYRWSFEEDVAHYRQAGFSAIGVWRQKIAEYGEEKGIELLAESGLAVTSLLWCGGFTGSEGRSFRECIDDACEAVELAAEMRAGCLVVYSGGRGGHTHNHARRLLRDALKELLPQAREQGVTLAVEPMHPDAAGDCTFLTDVAETIALIGALGESNLKIVFDTYHAGFSADWEKKLAAAAPHLALVHVGDGKPPADGEQARTRLGEGVVPLREMLTALKGCGYTGPYEIELIGADQQSSGYPDLLTHSREAWTKLVS